MSLAGPVPGIVIGWVLLALTMYGDWELPWLSQAAWVFSRRAFRPPIRTNLSHSKPCKRPLPC